LKAKGRPDNRPPFFYIQRIKLVVVAVVTAIVVIEIEEIE
jgi:hypothetical protein